MRDRQSQMMSSLSVSQEVDKVKMLYTEFVSLAKSDPMIHTLVPPSPKGEICATNVAMKEGKLSIERDAVRAPTAEFSTTLKFEQDPVQILNALLHPHFNSQLRRSLQECGLAARSATSNATVNAVEPKKDLSRVYNRQPQAKIIREIV